MQTSVDTQGTTKETKPANPWEFLGRMKAELDYSHSAKSLEAEVTNLAPDQARGMVTGYTDWLLEQGENFTAYAITQASWEKFIMDGRERKVQQALEGIVSKELPQKHKEDSEDAEHFRTASGIVQNLIAINYAGIRDVALAAIKHNPEMAVWIYKSQGAANDAERVALAVFDRDPELTFGTISDTGRRIALITKLLYKEQPTGKDYSTAFTALGRTQPGYGQEFDRLYARIAEATLETEPMLAFAAAKKSRVTELLQKAKRNLIRKVGGDNPLAVKEAMNGVYPPLDKDPEALTELAKAQYAHAEKTGSRHDYARALEAFRTLETVSCKGQTWPEKERCIMQLVLNENPREDRMPYLTVEETVTAGLAIIDTHPGKAYLLLSGNKDHPLVKPVMAVLSDRLEAAGLTGSAYMAEISRDEPRYDMLERLTKKMIETEEDRIPFEFRWTKDTGAMIGWYVKHGAGMKLGDRYETALDISNLVEDDCLVQPLREELMKTGVKQALHIFHYKNDATGIAMLKEYILQQAPGLAEHEEAMIDILGLRTREEAEQRRQKRN